MAFEFERIALYLNLVTKILNNPANRDRSHQVSLKFLTGKDTLKVPAGRGTASPVETQVLAINNGGTAFWIANNDPNDTQTQANFMKALKIDSFSRLKDHVDTYQGSVLPTNGGRMSMRKDSARGKDGLLYRMMMDGKEDRDYVAPGLLDAGAIAAAPAPADVPIYSLNSPRTRAPLEALSFITGDYAGAGGSSMHAEQRMLDALSRLKRKTAGRRIDVAGCKGACEGCASALANAKDSLHEMKCELGYHNAAANRLRDAAGIGERGAVPNLCILDPALFPVAERADVAAAQV